MAKFKVRQIVLCEVEVHYGFDASSDEEAFQKISKITSPTSYDGADHEIISDELIKYTKVERFEL